MELGIAKSLPISPTTIPSGYPKLPVRDFALDKFLQTLRKEMGSKEKFTNYMTEVIAAILPVDYKVNMASFEPAELNPATGQPKPKRGAKLDF